MALLQARWRRQGREIGFGVGIARGYATLGQIGFAERIDYTAIGTVCNLAARLCAEAEDGQILISRRVAAAVEDMVRLEEIGDLALKGLMQAVAVYNVTRRAIERGARFRRVLPAATEASERDFVVQLVAGAAAASAAARSATAATPDAPVPP